MENLWYMYVYMCYTFLIFLPEKFLYDPGYKGIEDRYTKKIFTDNIL